MRTVRVEVATTAIAASRPELLEPAEFELWKRLRYRADRDRLSTGVLLRRAMLSQRAGRAVPVERRCRGCGSVDHGEVQPSQGVDRARWRTSLSHSGSTVVAAVAEFDGAGIELGVDVESISRMNLRMAQYMLSPAERLRLINPTRRLLCGIWTAKEATLKALGCGLHASMTGLEISQSATHDRAVRVVGTDPKLLPLGNQPACLLDLTQVLADGRGDPEPRCAALMVLGAGDIDLVLYRLAPDELCGPAS